MNELIDFRKIISPEALAHYCANGNIGAFTFAREALKIDEKKAIEGLMRLDDINVIGEYLYVFWNDCCDRNTEFAIKVMNEYSAEDILDHLDNLSRDRWKFKMFNGARKRSLKEKIHESLNKKTYKH